MYAAAYRKRLTEVAKMLSFVTLLKQELKFTSAPPYDLLMSLQRGREGTTLSFVDDCICAMNSGAVFSRAFSSALQMYVNSLNGEEVDILSEISSILGRGDLESQLHSFDLVIKKLDLLYSTLKSETGDKVRMAVTMGTVIGFFLLIVLI